MLFLFTACAAVIFFVNRNARMPKPVKDQKETPTLNRASRGSRDQNSGAPVVAAAKQEVV